MGWLGYVAWITRGELGARIVDDVAALLATEAPEIVAFDALHDALERIIDGVRTRDDILELFGDEGLWLSYDEPSST